MNAKKGRSGFMYKIAILGCENSHADSFLRYIRENDRYSDIKVVGVYSIDRVAAEKLSGEYGVSVMESFDQYVGQLDGLIITARHGGYHYKFAKPYLDDGIPMFIDKPITVSEEDAVEFATVLKKKGIRVSGGSSLVYSPEIKALKEKAPHIRTMVGGAVLSEEYAKKIQADFYAKDAMQSVRLCDQYFGNI